MRSKQFLPRVVFYRGGLRFVLALRTVLPVIVEALLNRTDNHSGSSLFMIMLSVVMDDKRRLLKLYVLIRRSRP